MASARAPQARRPPNPPLPVAGRGAGRVRREHLASGRLGWGQGGCAAHQRQAHWLATHTLGGMLAGRMPRAGARHCPPPSPPSRPPTLRFVPFHGLPLRHSTHPQPKHPQAPVAASCWPARSQPRHPPHLQLPAGSLLACELVPRPYLRDGGQQQASSAAGEGGCMPRSGRPRPWRQRQRRQRLQAMAECLGAVRPGFASEHTGDALLQGELMHLQAAGVVSSLARAGARAGLPASPWPPPPPPCTATAAAPPAAWTPRSSAARSHRGRLPLQPRQGGHVDGGV